MRRSRGSECSQLAGIGISICIAGDTGAGGATALARGGVPREDTLTPFLVVKSQPDGSLTAFLRNPERNIGVFMDVQHLVVNETAVELRGHRMGATEDVVLARGTYHPERDTLSIYIPSRGDTFDFRRIDGDPESSFYSRAKEPGRYVYRPPPVRTDGWQTAALDDVGISRERITAFVQMLIDMPDDSVHASNIHGVLLARHGKLVLEGTLFDRDAINRLRSIFAKVCRDFGAQLVELDGEHDHMHLLVEYPPKVAVSSLVNSLKGVSSRLLRDQRPDLRSRSYPGVLWSPSYFAASCGGAPIDIVRQYIEHQKTPQ